MRVDESKVVKLRRLVISYFTREISRDKFKTSVFVIFCDFLNQIIKCLNRIIGESKLYNLRLCTFTKLNFKGKISK